MPKNILAIQERPGGELAATECKMVFAAVATREIPVFGRDPVPAGTVIKSLTSESKEKLREMVKAAVKNKTWPARGLKIVKAFDCRKGS